jgi:hypothetical protein
VCHPLRRPSPRLRHINELEMATGYTGVRGPPPCWVALWVRRALSGSRFWAPPIPRSIHRHLCLPDQAGTTGSFATPAPALAADLSDGRPTHLPPRPKPRPPHRTARRQGRGMCEGTRPALRSHVPGTLGTRDGNVKRGTSFRKIMERRGYTYSVCSYRRWNTFQV